MQNKNSKIKFNAEQEFTFFAKRLSESISKEESLKGQQMKNYLEYSIMYNPKDVNYTEEELNEKLQKIKFIKNLLEKQLEENKNG